jgi:hypothetical protein
MELYDVIDAGVDWLTVTAKRGGKFAALLDYGYERLSEKREAGQMFQPASRFGFHGHKTDHFFAGLSDHGALVVVSGAECVPLANDLILRADNVSRLDLQVTVSCGGEQPHLALDAFRFARADYAQHRTRRALAVRTEWPTGETFTFGKRISDVYGRLYDKATQANLGEPRTVWRYEVELKNRASKQISQVIARELPPASFAIARVHRIFSDRGVPCSFSPGGAHCVNELSFPWKPTDHLRWFRETVSRSVSKSVNRYGMDHTLEALGLSHLILTAGSQRGTHHE